MSSARARPDRRPPSTAGAGDGAPLVALVESVIEQRDLDQREVAEQLGLTVSALRTRLAQPQRLSRDEVLDLARALGVPRDRLAAAIAEAARGSTADVEPADVADPSPTMSAGAPPAADGPTEAGGDASLAASSDLAALLHRTLGAIADGPAGDALRLALLDAVREVLRAANDPPPPEYYDLRSRARHGERFAASQERTVDDTPATDAAAEDRAAIDLALACVRRVQAGGVGYADLFSPLHDDALAGVLASFAIHVHEARLADGGSFVVTPRIHSRHLLVAAGEGDVYRRAFARRQALGLVLAGAADAEAVSSTHADWPTRSHRAADLFALTDLAPFWQIHDLRRARLGWAAVADAMASTVRAQTSAWPEERVRDRASLRVALYRAYGV